MEIWYKVQHCCAKTKTRTELHFNRDPTEKDDSPGADVIIAGINHVICFYSKQEQGMSGLVSEVVI